MQPPPAQEALSEVATFQTMRDTRQEEAAQGLSFKSVWLASSAWLRNRPVQLLHRKLAGYPLR